jgi:GNAT superfamily N-acetyltransferase
MAFDIVLTLDPEPADETVVREGLRVYNKAMGGPTGYQPISIMLADESGTRIGGLTGRALYDWLFIELFHIPEALRGQGYGRQLMQKAEAFARERGLVGIWLDTFDFQARPFYEKLGFTVFGTLGDHPRDGRRYFMQKRLDGASR